PGDPDLTRVSQTRGHTRRCGYLYTVWRESGQEEEERFKQEPQGTPKPTNQMEEEASLIEILVIGHVDQELGITFHLTNVRRQP
ncbi:hypothetical protein P7K49_026410, partial [Saguinus oedipus]